MNLESPKNRIIIGVILILVLAGLCTHYANEYEKHLKHPSYGAILSDYPQGEVVNVGGTVTHIYSHSFQMQENYHGQIVTMTVFTSNVKSKNSTNSQSNTANSESKYIVKQKDQITLNNQKISLNDKVTLVGVLGPDNQIVRVQEIDVNEYTNYILLLLRSFLALAFIVYIFNHYWYFNLENYQFRRR